MTSSRSSSCDTQIATEESSDSLQESRPPPPQQSGPMIEQPQTSPVQCGAATAHCMAGWLAGWLVFCGAGQYKDHRRRQRYGGRGLKISDSIGRHKHKIRKTSAGDRNERTNARTKAGTILMVLEAGHYRQLLMLVRG